MPKLHSDFKTYWRKRYTISMCVALNKPTAPDVDVYRYINIDVISSTNDNYGALIEAAKYVCTVYPHAKIDWVDTDVVSITNLGTSSFPTYTFVECMYNYPIRLKE